MDYIHAIIRYPDTTFLCKELVHEICRYWAKMDSVTRYSDYEALEPGYSKLTALLRSGYWHFQHKWDNVKEIF